MKKVREFRSCEGAVREGPLGGWRYTLRGTSKDPALAALRSEQRSSMLDQRGRAACGPGRRSRCAAETRRSAEGRRVGCFPFEAIPRLVGPIRGPEESSLCGREVGPALIIDTSHLIRISHP